MTLPAEGLKSLLGLGSRLVEGSVCYTQVSGTRRSPVRYLLKIQQLVVLECYSSNPESIELACSLCTNILQSDGECTRNKMTEETEHKHVKNKYKIWFDLKVLKILNRKLHP